MKQKEKKLGRPRNVDKLPIPRGAMKQIKAVAEEAKIPVEQVFEDVIENGLCTVREMYASLINFRKTRKSLHEPKPDKPLVESAEASQEIQLDAGTEVDSLSGEFSDDFRGEPEPEAGHSDDISGPGFTENGEVTHVFDERAV